MYTIYIVYIYIYNICIYIIIYIYICACDSRWMILNHSYSMVNNALNVVGNRAINRQSFYKYAASPAQSHPSCSCVPRLSKLVFIEGGLGFTWLHHGSTMSPKSTCKKWPLKRDRCGFHNLRVINIGSMYAIYGNIYHQYTPNVSIYTIHGSYGIYSFS